VSCQFALHYAWDTPERAEQVLKNGAERLASEGYFVLTFPDWEQITARLFRMMEAPDKHNWTVFHEGLHTYRIGGPRHYLDFQSEKPFLDFMQELQTEPFGRRYTYYQEGAVHGVPEYLVEPYTLRDMCAAMGLTAELDENFLHFDAAQGQLRRNMGAAEPMDCECRRIASLYRALVLRKDGQPNRKKQRKSTLT